MHQKIELLGRLLLGNQRFNFVALLQGIWMICKFPPIPQTSFLVGTFFAVSYSKLALDRYSFALVYLIPPCLVWAEMNSTVHVALPIPPINQFISVHQSTQQAL